MNSSRIIDWPLFLVALTITTIGLLSVYSATSTVHQPFSLFFKKQLIGAVGGIIVYFIFAYLDYRALISWGYTGYLGVLILLLITLVKGRAAMGGRRWLDLTFIRVQPSELAKMLLPAFVAHYLTDYYKTTDLVLRTFIPLVLIIGLSFLLIAKQPDLGTAIVVALSGLILVWLAQVPHRFFIYFFCIIFLGSPIFWQFLKPYQKKRVLVFLGASTNAKDSYQLEQSIIAVGSGGLLGKGVCAGTQNKLRFLPESRTDFIFAVLCEECGFFGALGLLLLYFLMFARIWYLIYWVLHPCAQLCAIGLALPLVLDMLINIAMVLGLVPLVGIPLPFMSYGMANLLVNWASLGWLQAIVSQKTV